MRKSFVLLLALLTALAFGQTNGRASRIAAKDLARLRQIKKRFALPTYVPAGFKVKQFTIEKPKNPVLLTWIVRYINPKTKAEFLIQMCSDGIGDVFFTINDGDTVEGNGVHKFRSRTIGNGEFESYVKGKERQWHLNWVEFKSTPRFLSLIGYRMSAAEGKKIIESLRWLR